MQRRMFLRSVVATTCTLVVGLLALGCQQTIGAGDGDDDGPETPSTKQKQDLWTTNAESASVQSFASSPLPAGFFDFDGRVCDAFAGATAFVGSALSQNTTAPPTRSSPATATRSRCRTRSALAGPSRCGSPA